MNDGAVNFAGKHRSFANDLLNLNGGYLILGIETDTQGNPVLPPRGVGDADRDRLQREILGQCNRIEPFYHPGARCW